MFFIQFSVDYVKKFVIGLKQTARFPSQWYSSIRWTLTR